VKGNHRRTTNRGVAGYITAASFPFARQTDAGACGTYVVCGRRRLALFAEHWLQNHWLQKLAANFILPPGIAVATGARFVAVPALSPLGRLAREPVAMPIQFACPHCGKQTVVADQFAGQTGPCAACGQTVTVPVGGMGSLGAPAGPARSSSGPSVLLVILGVFLFGLLICGGLAVALIIPAANTAKQAAKRMNSMNHLKQLGIALHSYHDVHGCFPPAVVNDAQGNPLYSGRVLLLPYLEQSGLYERFDKSKAWDSPENLPISQTMVPTFLDPARTTGNAYRSDYVFVTGQGTVFEANRKVNIAEIVDGTSNTVAMFETSQGPTSWAEPSDWDVSSGTLPPGNHERVRLFLYCDGSIRPVDHATAQQFIRAITSRNGGEVVSF
jgi:ribosomal protein S27E